MRATSNLQLLTVLTLALAAQTPARGAGYTFTNIADGTGAFYTFANVAPSVNASGTVAFVAGFDGGSGIYTGSGGAFTTIAETTGPDFASLSLSVINAGGTVAFHASRKAGGTGIYTGSGGATTTIALSRSADSSSVFTGFGSRPSMNTAGTVAFYAERHGSVGGGSGLYTGNGGALTTIVQSTDADFNGIGTDATINDSGTVAFLAGIVATIDNGVFTRNGAVTTEIARTHRASGSGPFTGNLSPSSINSAGRVAFLAGSNSEGYGVYAGSGGALETIADGTTGPYFSFGEISMNTAGAVAFYATLDGGGAGIFTGPDPLTDKVIGIGDSLFGSTVSSLFFSSTGLNDQGQIAFGYILASGQGIAITAVPEPATTALVFSAALLGLMLVRRRRGRGQAPEAFSKPTPIDSL